MTQDYLPFLSDDMTATNVYAPTSEVGERLAYCYGALATGATFYAYHDQLDSTRRWRWQNKNLFGSADFGPYGEKYASTGTSPALDYALHVQDPYTLCYHAPYREYAAGWARWTTRDPLGMVDGPNEYAYVGDRPSGFIDPMGHKGLCFSDCRSAFRECILGATVYYSARVQIAYEKFWAEELSAAVACGAVCGANYACIKSCMIVAGGLTTSLGVVDIEQDFMEAQADYNHSVEGCHKMYDRCFKSVTKYNYCCR